MVLLAVNCIRSITFRLVELLNRLVKVEVVRVYFAINNYCISLSLYFFVYKSCFGKVRLLTNLIKIIR